MAKGLSSRPRASAKGRKARIPKPKQPTMEPSTDTLASQIDPQKVPRHVAVIMDGNGRWAKKKGNSRIFGHKNGVEAVRQTVEAAAELGVRYLTLYAFSTENWNRPALEVSALMSLLMEAIGQEMDKLMRNQIRLLTIGDTEALPDNVRSKLRAAIEKTSANQGMRLVLALSYSARWELAQAARAIALKASQGLLDPERVDQRTVEEHLATAGMPDPELMIRTSGERRVSNFLLWQLAYAELAFVDKLWPDFRKEDFHAALLDYQGRERRFGLTSEQLEKKA